MSRMEQHLAGWVITLVPFANEEGVREEPGPGDQTAIYSTDTCSRALQVYTHVLRFCSKCRKGAGDLLHFWLVPGSP